MTTETQEPEVVQFPVDQLWENWDEEIEEPCEGEHCELQADWLVAFSCGCTKKRYFLCTPHKTEVSIGYLACLRCYSPVKVVHAERIR